VTLTVEEELEMFENVGLRGIFILKRLMYNKRVRK
jgi:hypothetical protein